MDRFKNRLLLATLVVVLFGAMSATALAAGAGDPFRLGIANTINGLTTLSGSMTNAMLQVVNSSTGAAIRATNTGGGPALDLRVEPGKAPFKVNSNAKVLNLNADLFDGLNSSAFQPVVTGSCAVGSSISAIAADGSVTCETDDNTTYTAGVGLVLSGTQFRAQGTPFANTRVVATSGGDFTSVQAALDSIEDASATNPYLVYVAAGIYDGQVTLKPFVTLEGAGEAATTLRWTGGNQYPGLGGGSATLIGANNAEVRLLTVESDGAGWDYAVAMYNNGYSPSLRQVTATASGANFNYGVYNTSSWPTMQQVTASASGGNSNQGVYNISSSPTMEQVTARGSGGSFNTGLANTSSSSPTIRSSAMTGTTHSIFNNGSGMVKVANSQLMGPLSNGLVCFANYTATLAPITCP